MKQKSEDRILLLFIDPRLGPNKIAGKYIESNHSLYPILKFLQEIIKKPELQESISEETINKIREDTLTRLTKQNLVLTEIDVNNYEIYIDSIGSHTSQLNKNFPCKGKILESILLISETLKKNAKLEDKQRKLHRILESHASSLLRLITNFYLYERRNLYIAESYCQKYLNWLQKIKHRDEEDIQKNIFLGKAFLAKIYFEFGQPDLAILLFKEAHKILTKLSTNDLNNFLKNFFELYQSTVFHFENQQNFLQAIDICHQFFNTFKNLNENIKKSLQEHYAIMEKSFEQLKLNYKNEFSQKINASIITKEHLESVSFNFKGGYLILSFMDNTLEPFIKNTFMSKGIECKQIPNEPGSKIKFQFNLNACNTTALEKGIKSCVEQKNRFLELKLVKEKQEFFEKDSNADKSKDTNSSSNEELTPEILYQPIFSSKKQKEETKTKTTKNKNETQTAEQPANVQVKASTPIEYYWPQSNLTYSSINHTGAVKKLRRSTIPENACVWFGYIPTWVQNNENYNPEFENKLSRGSIEKNGIRDITKELLTWNNQNFSEEKPYVFKIVIPGSGRGHDERLYGWIQETNIDEQGAKHHLVCFGHLSNHKGLYLPDPNTIMRKENKEAENTSCVLKPQ